MFFFHQALILSLFLIGFFSSSLLSIDRCFTIEEAGITREEWNRCERFLSEKAESLLRKKRNISQIHVKKLPFPIEVDPRNELIYIHLKGSRNGSLGHGCHKTVTKSIIYKDGQALLAARCESDKSGFDEAHIMKKLRGLSGIVQIISEIQRGNNKIDLFLEYYPSGSLLQIEHGDLILKERELFTIGNDLLTGLNNLHEHGYMHRDLHRGNMLIKRDTHITRAALVDFGKTIALDAHLYEPVSIPRSSCPPEILLTASFRKIDRIRAEAYALGLTFYIMTFCTRPDWTGLFDYHRLSSLSASTRRSIYRKMTHQYARSKKRMLSDYKNRPRSLAFATLAYKLLNPNPRLRPTVKMALQELQSSALLLGISLL